MREDFNLYTEDARHFYVVHIELYYAVNRQMTAGTIHMCTGSMRTDVLLSFYE